MKKVYEVTVRDLAKVMADYIATKVGKSGPIEIQIITSSDMKENDVIVKASYKNNR